MDEKKPTIDERLEALVQSLELMRLDQEAYDAKMRKLDARERSARNALLTGIAAYFEALKEDENGNGSES